MITPCKIRLPFQMDAGPHMAPGAARFYKRERKRAVRRAWRQYGEVIPDGVYRGWE